MEKWEHKLPSNKDFWHKCVTAALKGLQTDKTQKLAAKFMAQLTKSSMKINITKMYIYIIRFGD